jgi:phosphatidylserine synthase 2
MAAKAKTTPNASTNNQSTAAVPSQEKDPFEFLNKPHTITALIIAGIVVVYFAFTRDESVGTASNVKSGLFAACLVFLLFSMLQMRDGLFYRPHPAVWRIVMGAGVLYLLGLVFLLFQTVDDARQLFKYIDPKLGEPLPERNYAEHCELYTPHDPSSNFRNLLDTLNDEFIWAHLIGWWGKSLLLRDAGLCWSLSILFEIWEMTFQHMLPNFKECWWDHIILDIIVCNGLGIWLGILTCRYFSMKEYDWTGIWKIQPKKGRLWWRILQQFTPSKYDVYKWEILSNWKRFVAVIIMLLIFSIVELNAFFLKFLLWIPPPHPINIWRLLLWSAIGMPGLREYYQFVTDSTCKKFGTMAWICSAVVGVETLISIKFGQGHFPTPAPPIVVWSWAIFFLVFVVSSVVFFTRKSGSKPKNNNNAVNKKKE